MTTEIAVALPLGLDLPAGVTVDDVGLSAALPPEVAYAQLAQMRRIGGKWRWTMGDLVLDLVDRDLSRIHEAWQRVADMNLDTRTSLARSVTVAAAIPRQRRRPGLFWGHHETVAGLEASPGVSDAAAQDAWLQRAESHGWTVAQLAYEIEAFHAEPEPEPLIDPGPVAWSLPAPAQRLIAAEFARGAAAVALFPDGTWKALSGEGLGA